MTGRCQDCVGTEVKRNSICRRTQLYTLPKVVLKIQSHEVKVNLSIYLPTYILTTYQLPTYLPTYLKASQLSVAFRPLHFAGWKAHDLPLYTLDIFLRRRVIMRHTNQWHVERPPEEPPCSWGHLATALNTNYRPSAEMCGGWGGSGWGGGRCGFEGEEIPPPSHSSTSCFLLHQHQSSRMRHQGRNKFCISLSNEGARGQLSIKHRADSRSWHEIWIGQFYFCWFEHWLPWWHLASAASWILACHLFRSSGKIPNTWLLFFLRGSHHVASDMLVLQS